MPLLDLLAVANLVIANQDGEVLAYRVSKTALNQLTVTMAAEFKSNGDDITVIALYPGFVPTKLSKFQSRNHMDECIAGMVKVLRHQI